MYTRVCTLLVCLLSAVKKSEPLSRHAYVISVEALPCSAPNRSRLTCSGSPSPIISHGCGAGGGKGGMAAWVSVVLGRAAWLACAGSEHAPCVCVPGCVRCEAA